MDGTPQIHPQNCPFLFDDYYPRLIHLSLDRPYSLPKRHPDPINRFADRQTTDGIGDIVYQECLCSIISASLSISIANGELILRNIRLDHLSVGQSCLSVRQVYYGKTADWTRVPFGMVNGVTPGIHVLDGGPRASRRKVDFGVVCPLAQWFQWRIL